MEDKAFDSFGAPGGTSRRNLIMMLAGGAATLAIFAAPTASIRSVGLRGATAGIPGLRNLFSLAHAEMDEWQSRAGATFRAAGGHSLRLAGIEPLPSRGARPAGLRDRAFLAVFDVAGGAAMPANLTYRVVPPSGPAFDLFLTSAGRPGRMHALFN